MNVMTKTNKNRKRYNIFGVWVVLRRQQQQPENSVASAALPKAANFWLRRAGTLAHRRHATIFHMPFGNHVGASQLRKPITPQIHTYDRLPYVRHQSSCASQILSTSSTHTHIHEHLRMCGRVSSHTYTYDTEYSPHFHLQRMPTDTRAKLTLLPSPASQKFLFPPPRWFVATANTGTRRDDRTTGIEFSAFQYIESVRPKWKIPRSSERRIEKSQARQHKLIIQDIRCIYNIYYTEYSWKPDGRPSVERFHPFILASVFVYCLFIRIFGVDRNCSQPRSQSPVCTSS